MGELAVHVTTSTFRGKKKNPKKSVQQFSPWSLWLYAWLCCGPFGLAQLNNLGSFLTKKPRTDFC